MDSHGGWIARPTDIVQFFMHVDGFAKPPNILKPATIQIMTTPTAVNPSDSDALGDLDKLEWDMIGQVKSWHA